MVEVTLPIILQIVQTVGILVGIVYYITIMRNTQKTQELTLKAQEEAEKTRKKELIILRSQSYSLEYTQAYADTVRMRDWETVEEFHSKYGLNSNPDAFAKWIYIRSVYNMAGLLLKETDVDSDLIFQLYAPNSVIQMWETHESLIKDVRIRFKHPTYWEPFEFLYNEARKMYPEMSNLEKFEPYLGEETET